MPGLYEQKPEVMKTGQKRVVCKCQSCACKNFESKRTHNGNKNVLPPNAVVFQLPRYREPKSDTYSHTVYKKEMCSRYLMKQHALLAQKKLSQRSKQVPLVEPERFACKTTTDSEYRRYSTRESAACKAKFPRVKRKEDFYFRSGEYSCNVGFPKCPVSHDEYSPKLPIPSTYSKGVRECDMPPFEGMSCYSRDFRAPTLEAYAANRRARKIAVFD